MSIVLGQEDGCCRAKFQPYDRFLHSIQSISLIGVVTQTATPTTKHYTHAYISSSLLSILNSSDGFTAKWVLCHAACAHCCSWSPLHSAQRTGCFHSPIASLPLHLLHPALSFLPFFLVCQADPCLCALLSSPICPSMADAA